MTEGIILIVSGRRLPRGRRRSHAIALQDPATGGLFRTLGGRRPLRQGPGSPVWLGTAAPARTHSAAVRVRRSGNRRVRTLPLGGGRSRLGEDAFPVRRRGAHSGRGRAPSSCSGARSSATTASRSEIGRGNGLPTNHEVLLGALHSAAKATKSRALLLIDAINEGPDPKFWQRELAAIIGQVKRFPRVALVVSVRDAFLGACVREDARDQLVLVVHKAFAYDILEAQRAFFRNFGIREPPVPLLRSEFANPLFLTLFCKGIKTGACPRFHAGSRHVAIFDFFVDTQNEKISGDLDVDPEERIVHRALEALTSALSADYSNTIDRAQAKALVDTVHPTTGFSRSLFGALEHEGLISKVRYGDSTSVRFTYERMADHARARGLLADIPQDVAADDLGTRLSEVLARASGMFGSANLFEALCLQVPERHGRELLDLLSHR